jgi:hypothetical protein
MHVVVVITYAIRFDLRDKRCKVRKYPFARTRVRVTVVLTYIINLFAPFNYYELRIVTPMHKAKDCCPKEYL